LLEFIELLWLKVKLNLRSEAGRNYLSYGWWVLEPLLYMLMFYVVFDRLLHSGIDDFVAFLLSGLIPWLWFAKTIPNAAGSILHARGLILQVALPKVFFPLVTILQDTTKQLVVFVLFLSFLLIYGVHPSMSWLALLPLMMVQLLFITACSFFAAAVTPFLPDFRFLVGTGIQLLMFASGIFYSYERILPEHRFYFFLNPMATLIAGYRDVLLSGTWPNWIALGWVLFGSVIALVFMIWVLMRFDGIYPRLVAE
jgi:lipopolysaccharide transport system permease protein